MDLTKILGLDPASLRARTEETLASILTEWVVLAPTEEYMNGLSSRVTSDTSGEVVLQGPGVSQERGARGGRDMRDWLLASPKAKTSKTGSRYMRVPMKDDFRTASDNGKAWMTKEKPSAGCIPRVQAAIPGIITKIWAARDNS